MWTHEIFSPPRGRPLLTILPIAVAVGLGLWLRQVDAKNQALPPVAPTPRYDALLASKAHPWEAAIDLDGVQVPQPINLRAGQTLGKSLEELGLGPGATHRVVQALDGQLDVRKLRPGEIGLAYFGPAAELSSLRFDVDGKGWLELAREGDGWTRSVHDFVRDVRVRRIEGELEGFLETAIRRAGGRTMLAEAMSRVLQWDLDFNRDLRLGDRFRLVYEEVYLDGEYSGLGEVLALVYENRDRTLEAYRYGEHGHYDAEGRPLRKMFLRSPLPFSRVTSRFSNRRFHPILKVHRPHHGVDYGAPPGTPVQVTASGTVVSAGRNGGAGKMVKVRHANGYETSYLHLSGYAGGVRRGQRVAQGQVIGYVGSTGLATAPHLDYRVQRHGRWLDPLRLKSEPVEPIPRRELQAFVEWRDELTAALAGGPLPEPRDRPFQVAAHNSGDVLGQ